MAAPSGFSSHDLLMGLLSERGIAVLCMVPVPAMARPATGSGGTPPGGGIPVIPAWSLLKKLETIGTGAYGTAYLCDLRPPPGGSASCRSLYVAKRMFLQNFSVSPLLEVKERSATEAQAVLAPIAEQLTEVAVLEQLPPHVNIVRYYFHFIDDENYLNIVMEYCPGGDLESLIMRRTSIHNDKASSGGSNSDAPVSPFRLEEVLFLLLQLVVALRHIHKHGIIHRDIKPSNIFISVRQPHGGEGEAVTVPREEAQIILADDKEGEGPQTGTSDICLSHRERVESVLSTAIHNATGLTVKIGDFGVAKQLTMTMRAGPGGGSRGANAVLSTATVVGTPYYLSPQQCCGEPYTSATDMWSLGCVAYEIASSGKKCFPGDNVIAVVRQICSGEVPHIEGASLLDRALRPLLLSLLTQREQDRMAAADVLRSFFIPDQGDSAYADDFGDPEDIEQELAESDQPRSTGQP